VRAGDVPPAGNHPVPKTNPSRRNFPSLAQRLRLFAVDWLGTGLSGRPPYRASTREQSEDFFLGSLAEWRRAAGLEGTKMILVSRRRLAGGGLGQGWGRAGAGLGQGWGRAGDAR
jgi:hypothetical protein